MKFVDIKGEQEVLSITINPPKLYPGCEYYYPDGIIKGFFKKKTYFVGVYNFFTRKYDLYLTPQEAIDGGRGKNLFVKDGKIWAYGEVITILRSNIDKEYTFKYKDISDLLTFLETLETRRGVNMHSLVCLETPKIESLYEHKILGDSGFKETLPL